MIGTARRVLLVLALLVPLAVDPFGADTQGVKTLYVSLCGCGVLALGALEVLAGRRRPARTTLAERTLVLLAAWSAVSLLWARNPELGLSRVLLLPAMLGLAIVVREVCRTGVRARMAILALVVVGTCAMAFDVVAVMRGTGQLENTVAKHASVVFVHNNMAASFVTLLVPLLVAGVLGARGGRRLAWLGLLAGLLGYLALLHSRAGLLGALLAVGVVGLLFLLRGRLQGRTLPVRRVSLVVVLLLAVCLSIPFSERARGLAKDGFYRGVHLLSFDVQDVSFRPLLWRKTIEMVREHPLRGVGSGNFVVEFPRFERQASAKPHAHNDGLQVLAELGLPGLLLFMALLVLAGTELLAVLCSRCGSDAWVVAAGVFGSLLVFVLGGQFEVPFSLGATAAHLAVIVGIAGALRRLPEAQPAATTAHAPAPAPAPGAAAPAAHGAQATAPTASAPSARGPAGRASRAVAVATLLLSVPMLGALALRVPGSWLIHQAERRVEAGDTAGARPLFERVAALHTGSSVPERMLGVLCLNEGKSDEALVHFRCARKLWPWSSELAEDEGDAHMLLEDYPAAVDCYQQASERNPTRLAPMLKLILSLDRAGRLREATEMLQYRVRTDRATDMDVVQRLADMWVRLARAGEGSAQVEGLVAARHFYAVLLQEGPPERMATLNATFSNITHLLQVRPGSPTSWWEVYERYLRQNSLRMPNTALWTSMDGNGKRLMPGWVEPLGPPAPGIWREPP